MSEWQKGIRRDGYGKLKRKSATPTEQPEHRAETAQPQPQHPAGIIGATSTSSRDGNEKLKAQLSAVLEEFVVRLSDIGNLLEDEWVQTNYRMFGKGYLYRKRWNLDSYLLQVLVRMQTVKCDCSFSAHVSVLPNNSERKSVPGPLADAAS